ncbi:MG2 domain-containing protein [Flagellimonas sp. DF-77]|uniref:alpha-2-macroglobulin family protein n=1 Tax=Flagellimonas algarum TaxID=3230298 RepID=UPI0033968BCE
MKKVLLLLFLLLGFQFVKSQNTYKRLWQKTERHEIEGKYKSASAVVDKIAKKSIRDNQSDQVVKAFIYKSKFALLLEEDARIQVLKELLAQIEKSPFPTNAILRSLYAGLFEQYLDQNRYSLWRRATFSGEVNSWDFEKWDLATLVAYTGEQYHLSILEADKLQQIPINRFSSILSEGKFSKKFRPTLYDFLAHRALNFHKKKFQVSKRPKERFLLTDAKIFAKTTDFVNAPFTTADSVFSYRPVLKIYQGLEAFHLNSDSTAYIEVLFERLRFSRQHSPLQDAEQRYFVTLENLYSEFKSHPASAAIGYAMAERLYSLSQYKDPAKNPSIAKNRIEAHRLCEAICDAHPTSDGGFLAKVLKNKIENPQVDIETENYQIPNQPFLARIDYRNLDSLFINVIRIQKDFDESINKSERDSILLASLRNDKPIATRSYSLPPREDFFQTSTEIDFDPLPIGHYHLVASGVENPIRPEQIFGYQKIQVTELAMLSFNNEDKLKIQVLDRKHGHPVVNAKISIDDLDKVENGETDTYGSYSVSRSKEETKYIDVVASRGPDTIRIRDYRLYQNRIEVIENKKEEHWAKLSLFLDRSIYRPGQTLYFKGLLSEKIGTRIRAVPDTWVTVFIYDSNYQDLKEFRLKTNEYGSVQGHYDIPLNVPTGEFTIELDEDYGTDDEDEDPYWEKIDDFEMAEIEFMVEEYKRPRFEVSFKKRNQSNVLGDSIKLKGSAIAFFGAPVKNGEVKYSITRKIESFLGTQSYDQETQPIDYKVIKTDKNGGFEISFLAVPDSTYSATQQPVFKFNVKADVIDVNGETRTGETTLRLGYHNLEVSTGLASSIAKDEPQTISFSSKNLNGEPIASEIEVSIFELQEPGFVFRKKPWGIPAAQILEKNQYRKLFPNEPYDSLDLKENWTKGKVVYRTKLKIEGNGSVPLPVLNNWKTGSYSMVAKAHDGHKDTVMIERIFDLFDPLAPHRSTQDIFEYKIINSAFKADGFVQLLFSSKADSVQSFLKAIYDGQVILDTLVQVGKKGSYVKIPIAADFNDKIFFQIHFVKYNTVFAEDFSVALPDVPQRLTFETQTFRNRLDPGNKETWRFKISGPDAEPARAEVLATMYDASLDAFKEHQWDYRVGYLNYKRSFVPRINEHYFFSLARTHKFWDSRKGNVSHFLKNHYRLNWFGLNFSNTEFRQKAYLKTILQEKKTYVDTKGKIVGIVTDSDGLPLPGVNIYIDGTSIGTQTDFDGFYTIDAKKNSVLIFTYIGQKDVSVLVSKSKTINVLMTEDASALEEVVVTAQGIKRDAYPLGYSVDYTTANGISHSIERGLSGKAAGVAITQAAGASGTAKRVVIRGLNSINANDRALFIVDGVPFVFEEGNAEEILLETEDIEDISVIKGSAATELYGSLGKNGVVLITTKKGAERALKIEPRTNLKETAFFHPNLETDSDGFVSVEFDSPQALTKWRFMMLAHTKAVELGKFERTAITQKELNVIPNYPRFLRVRDTLVFSSKIINLSSVSQVGSINLQLFNANTGMPLNAMIIEKNTSQPFVIPSNGDTNVSWKLSIPRDVDAIEFKVVATAGKISDGESTILPVLSDKVLITQSTPILALPNSIKKVEFEQLGRTGPTSKENHRLILEYTSNPAWSAIKSLPYLIEFPYECAEQTFSKFYANAITQYIIEHESKIAEVFEAWKKMDGSKSPLQKNQELKSILVEESPWAMEAVNESENLAKLGALFENNALLEKRALAINKLEELQLESGGFPWFSGGAANTFITRHIVAGFGHLQHLKVVDAKSYEIQSLLNNALVFLDNGFIKDHNVRLEKNIHSIRLRSDEIHYFYARSFFLESHPISEELESIQSTYLEVFKKDWNQTSLFNKAMIALILNRHGYGGHSKKIMSAIVEQAVDSKENGMYWKENKAGWRWSRAPIETQALIIEAAAELGAGVKNINAMKLWLLKNKKTHQWETTKSTAEAIYALLLQGSDWLSISDNTTISIGGQKVQSKTSEHAQKEAGTGYLKLVWNKKEINSEMAVVEIQNKSKVAGLGGFYWQYFETLDNLSASPKGPLTVHKQLFLEEVSTQGTRFVPIHKNMELNPGDMIKVRLEIRSNESIEFVHLKDLRASGLEPIDVLSGHKRQGRLRYYQSTRDVATHFFFDYLPKGSHVLEYNLRVNNRGDFAIGLATIQSMYAPEFSGNSNSGRLLVQ